MIRVDGRGFHKLSKEYDFKKPNDLDALNLMNKCARKIMEDIPDIILAYGDSDEYSFLLRKNCQLFERRELKLITTFSSSFAAYYQFYWLEFFPTKPLQPHRVPQFDARLVLYPNLSNIRDYFSWRQVDCHINNLYNTTFWSLVSLGGLSPQDLENKLIGTLAKDKNEILFREFGINYNNELEIFKKGTLIVRELELEQQEANEKQMSKKQLEKLTKRYKKAAIESYHIDIINNDAFWDKLILS